jgi:Ca2+-binding RTX toxin-like protein
MAFVPLSGGSNGNLDAYSIHNHGYYADTVLIRDPDGFQYSIYTWEGNDLIDNSRAVGNSLSQTYYSGAGNDRVIGGDSNESCTDGSGNDTISLRGGTDLVLVCAGDDVYDGGSGRDTLAFRFTSFDGSGAIDLNLIGVTVDLLKKTAQNFGAFGKDKVLNFENLEGGNGADKFYGTNGSNELRGYAGNDFLSGRGGNDTLIGQDGLDTYFGGSGADTLFVGETGALARDRAVYSAIGDSGRTAATWDTIINFDKGTATTDDRIDLSAIDANTKVAGNQAFLWRGTANFTSSAAGEVRLVVSGADTLVYVDSDADSAAEMIIKVQGVTGLAKTDFIL